MMGLSINGAVSWSYSGFNEMRRQVARHEGIDMDAMSEDDWASADTVLEPLLNHADDSGWITPMECAQMHERFREVVDELWPSWRDDFDGERARILADLMKDAAEQGYSLNFQ